MDKGKHHPCQQFWQDLNGFIDAYSSGIVVWAHITAYHRCVSMYVCACMCVCIQLEQNGTL